MESIAGSVDIWHFKTCTRVFHVLIDFIKTYQFVSEYSCVSKSTDTINASNRTNGVRSCGCPAVEMATLAELGAELHLPNSWRVVWVKDITPVAKTSGHVGYVSTETIGIVRVTVVQDILAAAHPD